ncbi:FliA/WhiG family RNA polymerase sigma factor [Fredinandcohnia quinoae]|uniref:FliA/WhiG family RNA polymerase sigma factor n=1 Tax=Fredinandcohnia quinoae TaxID=2918902 RepID=A0AAW5DWR2_9BACI|nr:FliA/WhiG family RNA polymerase sigma factor [Fredinandcohnia sp. SECRCQ15]MCH1623759.1 FliA/WhiG family RNA polymerase sigma factor [Fredinandcohnia sp. SECRCQ15]
MSQISSNDDQEYWQMWVDTRDPFAGDVLVRKYMPLVTFHVQRIAVTLPKSVNKDDLKSLGMIGLFDALEKFDPSRDLKFDTYASFRIRGAILDGLRKEDWLPRSSREKAKRVEAATDKLEQKLMRNVTIKEIAEEAKMSESDVYQAVNEGFFSNVLSMDDYQYEDDGSDKSAFSIKDNSILTPEEHIIKAEMLSQLIEVIEQLNDKEKLIISLFYKEELTLTEIGQVVGLSTSRISQIHSKALFKLKDTLQKNIH